jgi:hypothetical protein
LTSTNETFAEKMEPTISPQSTEYKKVVLQRAAIDRQGAFHLAETGSEVGLCRDVRQSRDEMTSSVRVSSPANNFLNFNRLA